MAATVVNGPMNQVLEIDLTQQTHQRVDITPDQRSQFLGGKGLALALLDPRLPSGIDPLGPDNVIVIMTGVVTGTRAPCSSRFHAVFKSPLTGIIGSSSCGGPLGRQLKTCGLDGLIIRGQSASPVLVRIRSGQVSFEPAGDLWGMDIDKAQQQTDLKRCASLLIGPAGENQVWFANAASGHRYLGRGGIGAVMGAKGLKGLVVEKGEFKTEPVKADRFDRLLKQANTYIKRNRISKLNRDFGTAANTRPVLANRMLPVHNFQYGVHDDAEQITGEFIARHHDTQFSTCRPCSILCGHKGTFNGSKAQVPEYETLALLGAGIGIFDPDRISRLNEICNQKGMDTISAGGTLAWVMEATQKKLIQTDLDFGDHEAAGRALRQMAGQEGFGADMARGSRWLARKYGGMSFAMQCKGLEMAGYDPRGAYGQGLGYAVANRGGCHLSSFPVAFEVILGFLNPKTVRAKHRFVKFFEDIYAAVNAMGICQFTGYAFTLEPLMARVTPDALMGVLMQHLSGVALSLVDFSLFPAFFEAVTGISMSSSAFKQAGERIHVLERWMNVKQGIGRADDVLPDRLVTESQVDDPENRKVPLSKMIDRYYRIRGYDNQGKPTPQLLKSLGLSQG